MYNLHNLDVFKPIPVVALTLIGEYVGEYGNINEAAFKLSLTPTSISKVLLGRSHKTKGYIFLKKDEYNPEIKTTYASIKRKRKFLKSKK